MYSTVLNGEKFKVPYWLQCSGDLLVLGGLESHRGLVGDIAGPDDP